MDPADAEALAPGPVETAGELSWPLLERLPQALLSQDLQKSRLLAARRVS